MNVSRIVRSFVQWIEPLARPLSKDSSLGLRDLPIVDEKLRLIEQIQLIRHPVPTADAILIKLIFVPPVLNDALIDLADGETGLNVDDELGLGVEIYHLGG